MDDMDGMDVMDDMDGMARRCEEGGRWYCAVHRPSRVKARGKTKWRGGIYDMGGPV